MYLNHTDRLPYFEMRVLNKNVIQIIVFNIINLFLKIKKVRSVQRRKSSRQRFCHEISSFETNKLLTRGSYLST